MPTIKAFYVNTAVWDADQALLALGQELHGQSLPFPNLLNVSRALQPQNLQASVAVYIYELQAHGESHTGVWAMTPSSDIRDDQVKKQAQCCAPDLELTTGHQGTGHLNSDPELITYAADPKIEELIDRGKRTVCPKTIWLEEKEHRLWAVREPALVEELIRAFGELGTVFLVNGHALMPASISQSVPQCSDDFLPLTAPFPYISALYMAENQLRSRPCHQLLKPGFPVDPDSFFKVIGKDFEIMAVPGSRPVEPDRAHQFGLYLDCKCYLLFLKQQALDGASFSGRLDGNILYSHLLLPTRLLSGAAHGISGIGGPLALRQLVEQLEQDRSMIAFTLYPASMNQIISAGYLDETLSPVTIWIEPKVPAGLLMELIQTEMF